MSEKHPSSNPPPNEGEATEARPTQSTALIPPTSRGELHRRLARAMRLADQLRDELSHVAIGVHDVAPILGGDER